MITEDEFHHGRDQVQELVNKFADKMNELGQRKEQEILEV
jgi:ribosome recycling factor